MGINNTKKLKAMRELLYDNNPSFAKPKDSLRELLKRNNSGYRQAATGNTPTTLDNKQSYGDSRYDDMMLSQAEVEQYGGSVAKMRAARQPWSHQLANGAARAIPNIVMSAIGQTAAALDFEDYSNVDNEVGNWLTTAMNKGKEALNEELPIYRENPGEALNLSDTGWWFENGFSLIESISSFVITGGVIAKTLTGLSRATRAMKLANSIMGANRAEAVGSGVNTTINAVMLNQSEAILEATDVYDHIYNEQLQKHGDEELAKRKAADGAAATVSFNRLNIPLNLTSAKLFFRTPKATRKILENPYTKANLGRGALEGGQESMEEVINMLASNYGKAVGMDQKYDIPEIIRDIATPEALEAALLGFLGGMGQTALTTEGVNRIRKTTDPETGEKISVRDYNIKQYENFKAEVEKLNEIAKQNDIGDFTSVFKSAKDIAKITKAIEIADSVGDTQKAEDLRKLLLANQAYTAFQRGTTEHLIKLYESLGKGEQKNGMVDNYRTRASEAVSYIRQMEKEYNRSRQYENAEKVYYNRSLSYTAKQEYLELAKELGEVEAEIATSSAMMIEQSNIKDLPEDYLTSKTLEDKAHIELADRVKNTPEYKAKLEILNDINEVNKRLLKLDKEHAKITSDDFQKQAKKQREAAERKFKALLARLSEQAEQTAETEEEAKRKEEVVKKQEEEADKINEEKQAATEAVQKDIKKIEDAAEGDIITVTPQMSKKFADKDATVIKRAKGKITVQINETGQKLTISEASLKKATAPEPKPSTPEDDYSTEGGENFEHITAEDVAKNDPTLDPNSPQPEDSGAKVVSTMGKGGDYLPFIKSQYPLLIKYERTPINKKNKPVTFEINTNLDVLNDKQKAALKAYQDGDFSDEGILKMVEHLPLNVVFRKASESKEAITGPLETLPYSNKNGAQDNFDKATRYLRAHIVNALAQGAKPEEIIGSIQDQYKGLLQIDETPEGMDVPENPVHELDFFNGDMSKVELFMVNKDGNLVDTTGKVVRHGFRGKGEIYTKIPQANGEPFFLKLNVKKVSKEEAEILYDLYVQRMTDAETKISTTLGDLPKELQNRIKKTFGPSDSQLAIPRDQRPYLTPLELIGKKMNDITIKDITDFLIYDNSKSPKSQVRLEGAKLRYGSKAVFRTKVEMEKEKDRFIKFLTENKRHHIKYRVKANDPSNTRIHAANRAYVNYLLGSKILNTNAVVGEPTFQGRTQIYLNLEVDYNKETIGDKHDPNKERPTKVKPSTPEAVDTTTVPETPVDPKIKLVNELIGDLNDMAEAVFGKLEELEDQLDALDEKKDADKIEEINKKFSNAENFLENLSDKYRDQLTETLGEEGNYEFEPPIFNGKGKNQFATFKMTEEKVELTSIYKDDKSNWTLEVKPDGTVINHNTKGKITDKRLINKAHLKSGYVKYQVVNLDSGATYAVTEDGRYINISKSKDGKPSPSSGSEITKESSTGKKVTEALQADKPKPTPKPRDTKPEPKTKEEIEAKYNATTEEQAEFNATLKPLKKGTVKKEIVKMTGTLAKPVYKIYKVDAIEIGEVKGIKVFAIRTADNTYSIYEETTGFSIGVDDVTTQKGLKEAVESKLAKYSPEQIREVISKGPNSIAVRNEMLENLSENTRKSGEKIVPLHEVPGTPEYEAKKTAEREKPKGEKQPEPPRVTKEEKEQQEEPDKQCGTPKPKKMTPAERKKAAKRRGRK